MANRSLEGHAYSLPGGSAVIGAIDATRLALRIADDIAVFDLSRGSITARRTIPHLQYVTANAGWLVVQTTDGPCLVGGDLAGDVVRWSDAEDLRFVGALAGVAIFAGRTERMRLDLATGREIDRVTNDVDWQTVHAEAGLLLGVRERTHEVVALRPADGAIVWSTIPFAQKVDALGRPIASGDEVHVRADVIDGGLVARIDASTGAIRGTRKSAAGLEPWLPDFGPEVEARALTFEHRTTRDAVRDGIVIAQADQVVVVRARGVARVAIPHYANAGVVGDAIATIVQDRSHVELVVIPLPADGDNTITIVPRGGDAESSVAETAMVTFAGTSAPIVVVQHPKYGRVNLVRLGDVPPPPVGATICLDGVSVATGGTVRVERWWIAGVRPPREGATLSLPPAKMAKRSAPAPARFAAALEARARAAEIDVPDGVRRFLDVVDREPRFREALEVLGFHFGDDENGVDVLPALAIEGFVPIWGNGFGDGFGGLTPKGIAFLWAKERTTTPVASIAAHVRKSMADAEADASVELADAIMVRERLG